MAARHSNSLNIARQVGERCLCFATQRAARVLARRFDQAFAPLELTNGQFSVMVVLNRPRPALMREVADALGMDRTTLTAALKPLEKRGLVSISVDPKDRRVRRLALTGSGKKLLRRAMPVWEKTIAAIETDLADPTRLRQDLRTIGRGVSM